MLLGRRLSGASAREYHAWQGGVPTLPNRTKDSQDMIKIQWEERKWRGGRERERERKTRERDRERERERREEEIRREKEKEEKKR